MEWNRETIAKKMIAGNNIITELSKNHINILGQYLKTNDDIGYVVLDVNKNLSGNALELLRKVKETIKVRMLY